MNLDEAQVESLRAWAREQAPVMQNFGFIPPTTERRPVRLEISAEPYIIQAEDLKPDYIVARVYLAEPRCVHLVVNCRRHSATNCECRPLAEKRIG